MTSYEDLLKLSGFNSSLSHLYDDLMWQQKEKIESLNPSRLLINQFKSMSEVSHANQFKKLFSDFDAIKKQQASIFGEQTLLKKAFQANSFSIGALDDYSSLFSIKKLIENSSTSEAIRMGARLSTANSEFNELINTNLILSPNIKSMLDAKTLLKNTYFPRIDITSVIALNNARAYENFKAQLDTLSIKYENLISDELPKDSENQLLNIDYWSLIYFIVSILLFWYQLNDSQKMENRLSDKIDKNSTHVQEQIQNVEKLLEKIVVANQNPRISGVEYIVKNRNTKVRSSPQNGSKIIAEIYPNQIVRLINQEGKWIEVEYYDWLEMKSTTGWILKKYLKRIQPSVNKAAFDNPDLPINFVRNLLVAKAQNKNGLTLFEPEN